MLKPLGMTWMAAGLLLLVVAGGLFAVSFPGIHVMQVTLAVPGAALALVGLLVRQKGARIARLRATGQPQAAEIRMAEDGVLPALVVDTQAGGWRVTVTGKGARRKAEIGEGRRGQVWFGPDNGAPVFVEAGEAEIEVLGARRLAG